MSAKDLDTLGAEIVALETTLLDAQRRAGDLVGDELASALADAEACCARLQLDQFYRIYFRMAREARSTQCHIHGEAIRVACPECAERNPETRASHDRYLAMIAQHEADESGTSLVVDLAATAAAIAEGKAHNVEPATTLRILHATRRTA